MRPAKLIGDGFDQDRLLRAELKRARRARRLGNGINPIRGAE
jgi:hypothetical protein